jgi:hypothetical protein
MMENMRRFYNENESFLSILVQPLEQTSIIKEAKIETLKIWPKSMLGTHLLKVKVAKKNELKRELSKDEDLELLENELKELRERKSNSQRIVSENKLESYLGGGWQFVSMLPSRKILIRRG